MMMAKRDTSTAVPRLRFPEFLPSAEWLSQQLGDVAVFLKGKGLPKSAISVRGQTPCIHYGELFTDYSEVIREVQSWTDSDENAVFSIDNDVLMPTSDVTPRGLAKASCIRVCDVVLGGDILVIRTDRSEVNGEFLARQIRYSERRVLQLVTGTTVFHLYASAMDRLALAFPSIAEQQKIADCLASLDEVIAAQARKVEALKAHKRGLMQQLFPREGETRPRLRFPDFRDAPEWEERPLGQVIEVASGQVDPTESPYCDLPHVGGENIECETGNLAGLKSAREDGVISGKYLFDERDVLYSKIRPVLNKVAVPDFKGICSADIYPIRPSNGGITQHFLVYLLRSASFVEYATKHSARGKIPKINREALFAYAAPLPQPEEQQRIADCLSSLDTQITAESNQLAALKTHKQGLMQQLFPASEATGA